ncbi:glycosyltransferase family 61 protein [Natronorarus salvus]|uniref:glycosyltransferase family 61 protein n=1 Tax=Natronorarus salvus TaxID=3117733 RepID=UPI002F266345
MATENGAVDLLVRSKRRYDRDGLDAIVKEGWDIGYRRWLVMSAVVPLLVGSGRVPILSRERLRARCEPDDRCWEFPPETTDAPMADSLLPKGIVSTDREFEEIDRLRFPRPFVCELRDATVFAPIGLATTREGEGVRDVSASSLFENGYLDHALSMTVARQGLFECRGGLPTVSNDGPTVDVACSLCPLWPNYYHWTVECLPRLWAIAEYERRTGRKPLLVIPPDPPRWLRESLLLAGFPRDRWLGLDHDRIRVNRLAVPTFPGPTPAEIEWIRERILDESEPSDDRPRIYITRDDVTRRRVRNESEVIDALSEYGVEPVALETRTVEEQARLFADAELIVGPHGAGFANLLYARDAAVVELFGKKTPTTFARLADALDLPYERLLCRSTHVDLAVDVTRLTSIIDELV